MKSTNPSNPINLIRPVILLILWLAVFYPVYPSLVYTWLNHSDNSHGILVPIISAFLIWQKRANLSLLGSPGSKWGALVLLLSMAVYVTSYAGGVAFVARSMIVTSLIGLMLFHMGGANYRKILFPTCFLFFMVPVPDSVLSLVSFPLQLLATEVSTAAIQALGVPAYREGNMVYFAQTQLEVADACSGIRSMVSYGMLAFIFSYLLRSGIWRRVVIVVSSVPLALFANVVRVTGTGVLAHFYGSKVARGFLHDFSGIVVFLFGLALLFLEYRLLDRTSGGRSESEGSLTDGG